MIPDAAVEAAAKADYGGGWDGVSGKERAAYIDNAKLLLEAAAPHIEKDAYERGWGAGFRHTSAAMKRQEFGPVDAAKYQPPGHGPIIP